jgi:hypothetical protein
MTVEKFHKVCKNAFNFDEALQRQNLNRESIELLRLKLKSIEAVPKFLVDNQVSLFASIARTDNNFKGKLKARTLQILPSVYTKFSQVSSQKLEVSSPGEKLL